MIGKRTSLADPSSHLGVRGTPVGRLLRATSTVPVSSGGGGWRRSKDKERYSDKYRMSGVRWCRVMGVACAATVRLSAGSQIFSIGWEKEPTGSRASCSLVDRRSEKPFEFHTSVFPPKPPPINRLLGEHRLYRFHRPHSRFSWAGQKDPIQLSGHLRHSYPEGCARVDQDVDRSLGSGPDWGRGRSRGENSQAAKYIWLGGGLRRRIRELGECNQPPRVNPSRLASTVKVVRNGSTIP
ncbi:hypothetical protein TIFTF001_021861 [Ficus carica]|uniref:Uncharacterized protein n=1 Tax=Ficus carica TaxID=3494 RepID=A0AA88AIU9_FICCA|nr:hypothetical protein TIFTF001_021861 [Ficus carica]